MLGSKSIERELAILSHLRTRGTTKRTVLLGIYNPIYYCIDSALWDLSKNYKMIRHSNDVNKYRKTVECYTITKKGSDFIDEKERQQEKDTIFSDD